MYNDRSIISGRQQRGRTEQMAGVDVCEAGSHADGPLLYSCRPTLSVGGMPRVDVEGLLTLPDGRSQREVGLHHPLLVVAVDNRFRGHGQRVTLGHVLGQGG